MRRSLLLLATVCATAGQLGCDPKAQKEFGKAISKVTVLHFYTKDKTLGPAQVAFIVGSAAPTGGPSALHALATDRIIPAILTGDDPDAPRFPFLLVPLPPHLADEFAGK